jgi:hypothetical protein
VKHIKKWREWEDLENGVNKTLKCHGRTYNKDIPNDEEKLMTQMINQSNYHKKRKRSVKFDEKWSQNIGKYGWEERKEQQRGNQ